MIRGAARGKVRRAASGGALAAVLHAPAAGAHGFAPIAPGDVWAQWSLDPLALVPLVVLHALYGRGLLDLRRRAGRWPSPALPSWRVGAFLAGEAALVVALLSPLDALAGTLLTAHMTQHVLLIAVAPPLLVLGRPELAAFRGLPMEVRRRLARSPAARGLAVLLAAASRPFPATLLHGAALWLWHAPLAFEAAGAAEGLHRLEHLCFFGTALLFWRALIGALGTRAAAVAGAAAALATLVHGGFLSALLTLSPAVLYPAATRWAPLWGLTPLEDQQLAGAIMWVPAGAAYLAAGLVLMARALEPDRASGAAPRPA